MHLYFMVTGVFFMKLKHQKDMAVQKQVVSGMQLQNVCCWLN